MIKTILSNEVNGLKLGVIDDRTYVIIKNRLGYCAYIQTKKDIDFFSFAEVTYKGKLKTDEFELVGSFVGWDYADKEVAINDILDDCITASKELGSVANE